MSRNVNSRFSVNPSVDVKRSKFRRNSSVKTTFNAGQVVPFYLDEVLPGDTFSVDTSRVVRLQTLLTPIMDNIYLDTYYFFVPNRLVWEHWQAFMGENINSAWIPSVEYSVPQVTAPEGGWEIGTIADYFGVPTGISNLSINALPFRAYAKVIDDWFRDQNLQDPVNIDTGDATVAGSNTGDYVSSLVLGGQPFVAAKYHDYFTSCLPSPQKGPAVSINTDVLPDLIPVHAVRDWVVSPATTPSAYDSSGNAYPMAGFGPSMGSPALVNSGLLYGYDGTNSTDSREVPNKYGSYITNGKVSADAATYGPINLVADLGTNITVPFTINDLRLAFAMQKFYEKDARGGTRYIELLKSHFGVTSPDARLQRSEYLGGNRTPININQVIQTSGSVKDQTPQGTVTAYSVTSDRNSDFTKSFVEHGFVIGVMVARYDHTYQQGLERMWSRVGRFDYYWPVFQSLGEQPVLNKEIFAQGTAEDDEVFGYQEAWADYRYKSNHVTGQMRSSSSASYDIWHLADDYDALPTLSSTWIREDTALVDRVLAVSSTVSDQFIADIYVQNTTTRPMPMYSIPGLIDHF